MDTCKHINKISPAGDHSILNPEKWLCSVCGTTESVWACLSCANVACGRYNEEHALTHYNETKHPIAIEVNEKYVFCYVCDEYVLNDNAAGDIKILRSALGAVATQSFHNVEARGKRILRSHSFHGFGNRWEEKRLRAEDLSFTALKFRRYYLLAKTFASWKSSTTFKKVKQKAPMPARKQSVRLKTSDSSWSVTARQKRAIVPGVTGLRNLGNTCYMNSVLQVLSHLPEFRTCIRMMTPGANASTNHKEVASATKYKRQTTLECFQHVSDGNPKKGGLNGGSSSRVPNPRKKPVVSVNDKNTSTLVSELHALLRVLWSGKWAMVSPHKMLHSVWNVIPFFKGFSQQDAQEFLCEFLDKVQTELDRYTPAAQNGTIPHNLPLSVTKENCVTQLFQGYLVSQVTCKSCLNQTQTFEPFMDLSLEFPDRFQAQDPAFSGRKSSCHIQEMLSKFTAVELLDGKIYACESCNGRRRRASCKPTLYTEAEKRLLIKKPPKVLRLHLKRFMWSGRNHRGKITAHVNFDEELCLAPYCVPDRELSQDCYYQLDSVVMHHGKGFGSGHYTADCYNEEAASWVHCNDSRMDLCSVEDVLQSQAYILVYTQRPHVAAIKDSDSIASALELDSLSSSDNSQNAEEADDHISFNYNNSKVSKYVPLKRRMSETETPAPELKRCKSTIW